MNPIIQEMALKAVKDKEIHIQISVLSSVYVEMDTSELSEKCKESSALIYIRLYIENYFLKKFNGGVYDAWFRRHLYHCVSGYPLSFWKDRNSCKAFIKAYENFIKAVESLTLEHTGNPLTSYQYYPKNWGPTSIALKLEG
jgi:hypothetical protein